MFYKKKKELDEFLKARGIMGFSEFEKLFSLGDSAWQVEQLRLCLRRNSVKLKSRIVEERGVSWERAGEELAQRLVEARERGRHLSVTEAKLDTMQRGCEGIYQTIRAEFSLRYPDHIEELDGILGTESTGQGLYAPYIEARDNRPEVLRIVEGPIGEELYAFYADGDDSIQASSNAVSMQRLLMNNGRTTDAYLLTEPLFGGGGYTGGVSPVVLYVEDKTLGFNYIYYTAIAWMADLREFVGDMLIDVVEKKLGITFDRSFAVSAAQQFIFPYVRYNDRHENVRSELCVANDIDVKEYISFVPVSAEVRGLHKYEFERCGKIAVDFDHAGIGFYGHMPKEYFVRKGSVYSGAEADLKQYVAGEEEITLCELSTDASDRCSTAEVLGSFGAVQDIIEGNFVNPAISKVYIYSASERTHAPHRITLWEPEQNVPFALSEVAEARVGQIFVPEYDLSDPQVLYVMSGETDRWYEYNYNGVGKEYLKRDQIKSFEVVGLTDASVLEQKGSSYVLGEMWRDGRFIERGMAGFLCEQSKKHGIPVRTMHNGAYLSMMNDMRAVWELLQPIINGSI